MKRTLSLIISFVMMATMVSLPAGVFAEEIAASGNEAAVTDTIADNQEGQDNGGAEGVAEASGETDVTQESTGAEAEAITEETVETDDGTESENIAGSENTEKTVSIDPVFAGEVNPLYADIISESEIPQVSLAKQKSASARNITYQDKAAVVATLRDAMEARQGSITLYYKTTSYDGTKQIFSDLFDAAVAHTGVPTEGDYLKWQWGTWGSSLSGTGSNGVYYLTLTYEVEYYTTAAQEDEVNTEVKNILSDLKLSEKSEYAKTKAIYDYICSNVTYDHANLNDETYTLKHSAYAAFIDKTAVCQGYALMFYRLALESGIDTRLIAGYGNGVNHGWNIIKIGKLYYNLDSTWDAEIEPDRYFLLGKGGFFDSEHVRWNEYNTAAFHSAYPMATADYEDDGNGNLIISKMTPQLSYTRTPYDGTAKTPKVTIPGLTEGVDFTVSYSNNTNIGTATITITAKENSGFTGSITTTFSIVQRTSISAAAVTLSPAAYTYDGRYKTPAVTVKVGSTVLKNGTDYTVAYRNNLYPGTATVIITGKDFYTGSISRNFTITKANQTIGGAATFNKAYGNKAFNLGAYAVGKLTYKTSNKKVATVSSAGKITIKNTGRATITITAAGTGTHNAAVKTVTINVSPKKVASVKAKAAKKKATISWKRDKKATGYQIVYSTDKKFKKSVKTVNISKNKTVKKTIKKLKKKKTYYVKVRAYKKVGGTKIYGPYSSVKKVKIK